MPNRRRRVAGFFALLAAAIVALGAGCSGSGSTAETPPPSNPHPPEPAAAEARAAVIRRDADWIDAECRRAAGGDWAKWQRDTEPYRARLKAKIGKLALLSGLYPVALEGRDGFPLFEIGATDHLNYLCDPALLDDFYRDRPVVAARRWLGARGIDLVFVPAPKMTEVYVEHFVDPCPADGVIAPYVRRTFRDLLEEDVEVVDVFSLLRPQRAPCPDYLYHVADTHWAPRAIRLTAKEVAERIGRYEFGRTARAGRRVVKAESQGYETYAPSGPLDMGTPAGRDGWLTLSEPQRKIAEKVPVRKVDRVTLANGAGVRDDPGSPVLVIGNSYANNFCELLVDELNLLIGRHTTSGQTTEAFADFLREPELLDHCRVVVWVSTEQHLTHFKPLPAQVADCLKGDAAGSLPRFGSLTPPRQ
jgi:hypothetical protein